MKKFGQLTLCLAIAAFTVIGVAGCQSGSRFAMFGNPKAMFGKPAAVAEKSTTKTVSHSENAEDRLEESFYNSVEASRLGGTSISHLPAGRAPVKKQAQRAAGPSRPQPGGSGSRAY
ncbi:MAG: hypothetical protein HOL01_19035 [Planctomycetaceae bacterium]|jgi:hypothetical protein|nr:hypothetical protein [Planctomycetaceae bacterium]MBT6485330.1 hypothetical protein [Planctomycetaceae bacterium]MBT6496635.1 hypothetical protein [Planctomycetaceae bacterium]